MDIDNLFQHAVAELNQSHFVQAEKLCHEVLDQQKEHIGALEVLALSLLNQNKTILSERVFLQLEKINPNKKHEYWLMLFNIAKKEKDWEVAKTYCQELIKARVDIDTNYVRLGGVYKELREFKKAILCYEKSIEVKPNNESAYCNLGVIYKLLGDVKQAIACYSKGLMHNPESWILLRNKANGLFDLGEFVEARKYYDKALSIKSDSADIQYAYHQFLLLEDFERGLPALDLRWDLKISSDHYRPFKQTAWQGEPLKGKSIVLWGEQGIGDKIMLAGLFDLMLAEADHVIYEASPKVYALFKHSFPNLDVIMGRTPIAEQYFKTDYHAPIMDILRWRIRSLADIVPRTAYLKPIDEDIDFYRKRLPKNNKLKVGIAWRGNEEHFKNSLRVIPFELFESLLDLEFIDLVNLQFNITDAEKETRLGKSLIDVTKPDDDCAKSAALMQNCDYVISVDSAPIHVAGAINKKGFLLLSHIPSDWRWFLERNDSPWYPSLELIRQSDFKDWGSVIKNVINKLSAEYRAKLR